MLVCWIMNIYSIFITYTNVESISEMLNYNIANIAVTSQNVNSMSKRIAESNVH